MTFKDLTTEWLHQQIRRLQADLSDFLAIDEDGVVPRPVSTAAPRAALKPKRGGGGGFRKFAGRFLMHNRFSLKADGTGEAIGKAYAKLSAAELAECNRMGKAGTVTWKSEASRRQSAFGIVAKYITKRKAVSKHGMALFQRYGGQAPEAIAIQLAEISCNHFSFLDPQRYADAFEMAKTMKFHRRTAAKKVQSSGREVIKAWRESHCNAAHAKLMDKLKGSPQHNMLGKMLQPIPAKGLNLFRFVGASGAAVKAAAGYLETDSAGNLKRSALDEYEFRTCPIMEEDCQPIQREPGFQLTKFKKQTLACAQFRVAGSIVCKPDSLSHSRTSSKLDQTRGNSPKKGLLLLACRVSQPWLMAVKGLGETLSRQLPSLIGGTLVFFTSPLFGQHSCIMFVFTLREKLTQDRQFQHLLAK